jgi:hypothetical protein
MTVSAVAILPSPLFILRHPAAKLDTQLGFHALRNFIVYQATPRDPLVLAGVVLAMLLLGLVATWHQPNALCRLTL